MKTQKKYHYSHVHTEKSVVTNVKEDFMNAYMRGEHTPWIQKPMVMKFCVKIGLRTN